MLEAKKTTFSSKLLLDKYIIWLLISVGYYKEKIIWSYKKIAADHNQYRNS